MSWLLSYWPSALVLVVMWLVVSLITGSWNPIKFAIGEDNRYSISKFQLLLWTVAVLFAYIAVVYARVEQGLSADVPNVPDNVLLALGLSGATSVVAKGIKVNNERTGKELSTTLNAPGPLSTLLTNDDGSLSLHKLQYFVWTFVAIGIFLVSLDQSNRLNLPDIDTTLLVLSGIGAGTYLGKKLVPQSLTEQNRVAQAAAAQGAQVTTQTTTIAPATVVVNVPATGPTPPPPPPAGGDGPPSS